MEFNTIREIVEEVCHIIWKVLSPIYMPKPTKDDWKKIRKEYKELWNFPNCLGSLDGNAFENKKLDVPKDTPLEDNGEPMPYVIVADEAFALKPYLMRPYSRVSVTGNERNKTFNYRLSRARRVMENAFGILSARWRVFRTVIQVQPNSVDKIVLSACCLHNMLYRSHDYDYYLDDINEESEIGKGLDNLEPLKGNSTQRSFEVRDKYRDYFLSSNGAVPWQYEIVRRGRIN
ncbi:hypothetical protein QTP88_010768 [Uroleucon formosanum]